MLQLAPRPGDIRSMLCLGAHCDDIEIGCGAAVMRLLEENPGIDVTWVIFSANDTREAEARRSAEAFLGKAGGRRIEIHRFRNGYFPFAGAEIKDCFEALKPVNPDLVFTHFRDDRHQDHRTLSDLTWNTFRDHFILEYEIPKYDGDLHRPNFFVPLSREIAERKVVTICDCFASQRTHHWFSRETFEALMRLRGIESNAPSGFAEAFYVRKACL